MKRALWADYRDRFLPVLQQVERSNGHLFSYEIDKALSDDRAFLFVSDTGFIALEPREREGEKSVHVQFAYNSAKNAIVSYQPEIEKLAVLVGATKIKLQTAVSKLSPILLSQGYELEKEIGIVQSWGKNIEVKNGRK